MMGLSRAHLTLPDEIIQSVDSLVGRRKRSAFFLEAAEERIRKLRLLRVLDRVAGSWKEERHPESRGKDGAYRFVRSLRVRDSRRLKKLLHE